MYDVLGTADPRIEIDPKKEIRSHLPPKQSDLNRFEISPKQIRPLRVHIDPWAYEGSVFLLAPDNNRQDHTEAMHSWHTAVSRVLNFERLEAIVNFFRSGLGV